MEERRFEERLEEMADKFSRKLEEIADRFGRRMDERFSRFGEKIEVKLKSRKRIGRDNAFWGVVLIFVGFFWLARNLHWFHFSLPFWPLILIIIGIYLILENRYFRE